jgi:predicted ATPase
VQRAADVPSTLLQGLDVAPLPGENAPQTLRRFLAARDLLLVADNFEHVLGAAPEVSGLLSACPSLRVLATSREWLSVRGERRYPVAPLAVPDADAPFDAVRDAAGVALFVQRARDQDPAFVLDAANASDVTDICRRLDGLPLAIELAAARIALMTPAEIRGRLNAMFAVLGVGPRDAPARHRTLRATIDWSHALLSNEEQRCFARFAVLVGDADIPAVEAVTGAGLDTLSALVAKSLVVRRDSPATGARLHMLETVRAYALERFSGADDRDTVRARHARWYLDVARAHGGARKLRGPSRAAHLAALDADIENIHAALRRALEQPAPAEAVAATAALCMYWGVRARTDEAFEYMDAALALSSEPADAASVVEILVARANFARFEARGDDVEGLLERAEAIARDSGDPHALCWALITRAEDAARDGRLDDAASFGAEATRVAAAAGDDWAIAQASYPPAVSARTIEELRERVARGESLLARHGSEHDLARLLASSAYAALYLNAHHDALLLATRAVTLVEGLGDAFMTMLASGNLGLAALLTGDIPLAAHAFRRELSLCRELRQRFAAGEALLGAAAIAADQGRHRRSARLVGAMGAHRYGIHQEDLEETCERRYFADARVRLGAEDWDVAEREGAAMSFEQAIAYALEEDVAPRR